MRHQSLRMDGRQLKSFRKHNVSGTSLIWSSKTTERQHSRHKSVSNWQLHLWWIRFTHCSQNVVKKGILDWLIEIKPQEYLDEFLEKMYLLYFNYLPSSILLWLLISLHFMSSADIWYAGSSFSPHPLWEGHCGSRSKDQATRRLSRLLLGSSTCPPASWETLKSLKSPGLALTSAPCGICWL